MSAPVFYRVNHHATVCVARTENGTYCDRLFDGTEKKIVAGVHQVCAVCRMAALAEGVEIPASVKL